tara:strand:+ start:822 stop:1490 length:669 start_codon:yes stop_codon:yes gene_type:complete
MPKNRKKKAVVFAGSRGVGKSIAEKLIDLGYDTDALSSKDVDTSNIKQVEQFIKKCPNVDILVLNTGGPPAKEFKSITKTEWIKYFNQLFLSFVLILQGIKVNKNGYVFSISSYVIREPDAMLTISNAYRIALTSIMKTYGIQNLKRNITTLNLALGPIYTDRLKELNKGSTKKQIGKKLPLGRVGNPSEIGNLVKSIVKNKVKYLNTQTLFIDGGISKSLY